MKILFYDLKYYYLIHDTSYPVGGATIQLKSWISGFTENNAEVYVLTLKGPMALPKNNIDFQLLDAYDIKKGIKYLRWIYYRYPSLYRAIKGCKPDVVIQAKAGLASGVLSSLCYLLNVPFVYRVANDIETDNRLKLNRNFYEVLAFKFALKFAKAIVCQNVYQEQQLKVAHPEKPMITLYNPFSVNQHFIVSNIERSYVAWLGIFQAQKNLPGLYEVVKALPEVEFRVAGDFFTPLEIEDQNALNNIKNCKNVKLVGFLKKNEIFNFLSNAYLLLNTSHYEGFSNTFLEAFSAGTPVVTTWKVDPDLIIFKNKLGESVESFNELSIAVNKVIHDPCYSIVSQRCFNYVKDNHDPIKLSKKYLLFLKKALS